MNNNIYLLIFLISILIASLSQVLLKLGAKRKNIYLNFQTVIGYLMMLFSTTLTLFAYKKIELSFSLVLQSLSFIFVLLFCKIILKEKISRKKYIGMYLIVIGILIYSK